MRSARGLGSFATRPIRIPALAVLLLGLSAVLGNLSQWEQRDDLKAQAAVNSAEIKALTEANNDQAECRSRIVGYVEGLSITQDIALGDGILDRLGPNDDTVFDLAIQNYREAVGSLRLAKEYRERSVEVCAEDPDFDPATDIPQE